MGILGDANCLRRTPVRRYATDLIGFPWDLKWVREEFHFFAFIYLDSPLFTLIHLY
jgi:hypothetical protein